MFFEITSSMIVGGIAGTFYLKQKGVGADDKEKIERIIENCGLFVKEKGTKKFIRFYKRYHHDWGTEYVYQLPFGLSTKDFEEKLDNIRDGINIKSGYSKINLEDIKKLKLDKTLLKEIVNLLQKREMKFRDVKIEFDGMLKIKVYERDLPESFDYTDQILNKCSVWKIPLGQTLDKFLYHDFEKQPHLLIGGATRYGKSVFIKNVITTLLMNQGDNIKLSLLDLKGGLALGRFENCPQVVDKAYTIDDAHQVLERLAGILEKRTEELRTKGFEDVTESGEKTRHFIIIDEVAELASKGVTDTNEKKKFTDCERYMSKIARLGAGIGLRLIVATQNPVAEAVPMMVKRNIVARLAFPVSDVTGSMVILDEEGADKLPLIKGRAIYKTVEKKIVQTPYIKNSYIDEKIQPLINIKPRNDEGEEMNEKGNKETTERRKYTLTVIRDGIRDEEPDTNNI